MNVFYNKEHVGDVLLVQLATESIVKTVVERAGDIAILKKRKQVKLKRLTYLMQATTSKQTQRLSGSDT